MSSQSDNLLKQMRSEAVDLFQAAIKRVDPYEVVREFVHLDGKRLIFGEENQSQTELDLGGYQRIFLVGDD